MTNRTFTRVRQNIALPLLTLTIAASIYGLACSKDEATSSSSGDVSSSSSSSGGSSSSSSSSSSGSSSSGASSSSSGSSGDLDGGTSSSSSGGSSGVPDAGTTCTNDVAGDAGDAGDASSGGAIAAVFTDAGGGNQQVRLCGSGVKGSPDEFTFTTPATVTSWAGSSQYAGDALTVTATQNGAPFNLTNGAMMPNATFVLKIESVGTTTAYTYTINVKQ